MSPSADPCLVARHLSSLTVTAQPPSYIAPGYYSASYGSGNEPFSGEYAEELALLSAQDVPRGPSESAYWELSRNTAVQLLNGPSP